MPLSDRQHDAFDNPAKASCRDGNLRVLRGASHLLWQDDSRARLRCGLVRVDGRHRAFDARHARTRRRAGGGAHLHQLEIDRERYSQPAHDGDNFDMDFEDERDVLLSKVLPKSSRKAKWIYEYDFGDGWRHDIQFEGFPPINPKAKYPLCLDGERACPREDCDGPPGYGDYLAAIADPQDEQPDELLEWRGPFDPEAFDAKKATKEMRKLK